MNIQEALEFMKQYTAKYGATECYGKPEWEIRYIDKDSDYYPGMYEVRCNNPEMIGGGSEQIIWMKGYRNPNQGFLHTLIDPPDFYQAYLTEQQVILLAMDLKEVEDKEAEEDDDHELWEDDFDSAVNDGTPPFWE